MIMYINSLPTEMNAFLKANVARGVFGNTGVVFLNAIKSIRANEVCVTTWHPPADHDSRGAWS